MYEPIQTIRLGDRVIHRGWPDICGRVKAFITFGKATLADVEWDSRGPLERVNVVDLRLAEGHSAQAA